MNWWCAAHSFERCRFKVERWLLADVNLLQLQALYALGSDLILKVGCVSAMPDVGMPILPILYICIQHVQGTLNLQQLGELSNEAFTHLTEKSYIFSRSPPDWMWILHIYKYWKLLCLLLSPTFVQKTSTNVTSP